MKLFVAAAMLVAIAAAPAGAETPMSYASGNRCLAAVDVDHTHVIDRSNILFYMRDGKIWQTHLTPACVNLTLSGFEMVGHPDQFCANAQTIKVLNGGAICQLGNFVPYNEKARQAS
ncbi:MAG TPA: hypothetical protein VGH02_12700 [Rhizomicrobium sp.]|jgi:hypothetical protein